MEISLHSAERIEIAGLKVARELHDFMRDEALPGTGIGNSAFWTSFSSIVHAFTPRNRELLRVRGDIQEKIDRWCCRHGAPKDLAMYKAFLTEIGYIQPEGPDFSIETTNVDPEIATIAGPQLVVPVMNARYALNAANARWGSLYDALYGTDAILEADGADKGEGFNPVRGEKVIEWTKSHPTNFVRPSIDDFSEVNGFLVDDGKLIVTLRNGEQAVVPGSNGNGAFVGYRGDPKSPLSILLRKNGLHAEILIDKESPTPDGPRRNIRRPARVGHHSDHGLRGFGRCGGCRGQGRRLP